MTAAVLPESALASRAALASGGWDADLPGFTVPGDLYAGTVPETAAKPYLRLDVEADSRALIAQSKRSRPRDFVQGGTAWASDRHLAMRIAAGAARRLYAAFSLSGYRVIERDVELLESLPPNPQDPGAHGAAFRLRFTLTPSSAPALGVTDLEYTP